jgi:L-rhamnose mutarotase
MQLHRGFEEEYKRRHNEIWPELRKLLKENGVAHYSIFLDKDTNTLFGVMQLQEADDLKDLPSHPVMKKWWAHMRDIMDTNPDNSPVSIPLEEVFYLP